MGSHRQAVTAAKLYLEMRGFTIIELNWRRSRSKIDIVCRKSGEIYLVEVFYDPNSDIAMHPLVTNSWLNRLREAAAAWIEDNKWQGTYHFSSIEIAGQQYSIMGFSEDIV